jgi:hypothetical protein
VTPLIHPASAPQSGPGASNPGAQPLPPGLANGPGPSLNNEPHPTNGVPNFDRALTAPPLPISQEKQGELQNLLSQYMANQITPAQYQEERAKIMAEP